MEKDNRINNNVDYYKKLDNYITRNFKVEDDSCIMNCFDPILLIDGLETELTFADKLNQFMLEKHLNSDTVWKKANIDRKLFSKVFNGGMPSKKTAILLVIALELNLKQALELLSCAGYTLSHSIKEDLIIKWHIINKSYSFEKICEALAYFGLKSLFD